MTAVGRLLLALGSAAKLKLQTDFAGGILPEQSRQDSGSVACTRCRIGRPLGWLRK